MNKVLTKYILVFAALLLGSGTAMAQRNEDPGQGQLQQEHRVIVGGDIYGGGNKAPVKGSCSVMIRQKGNEVGGDVYGGGALADVNVTAEVEGGNTTYHHTPNATTQVDILEGTIRGDVYGGGLGNADTAALVYGVVTVNIGAGTVDPTTGFATTVSGNATFTGNGFGGNVFGCNNINGTPLDNVFVNIFKTAHTDLDTVTNFTSHDYAIDSVFGGGNRADYEPAVVDKMTTVHVYTCNNTIQKVYGGGNAADLGNNNISTADTIIIDGGRFDWVFGGGNGAGNHVDPSSPNYNPGANIYGDVAITFHAGDVNYFFGGSNEKGNISGTKDIYILNDVETCIEGQEENHIGELYSGNNKADIEGGGTRLIMPCRGNDPCQVDYIFGGSRNANITGDVELTIIGGKYNYVFGGNNLGGTITGNVTLNLYGGTISQAAFGGNKGGFDENGVFHDGGSITGNITVNVEDQCECPLSVNDVFGAGDLAKYEAPTGTGAREFNPMVNVNHICPDSDNNIRTILGNVYGAGNGTTDSISQKPGMVTGNPKVTIGDLNNAHIAAISGNVYGGGNAAKVVGATTVLMQNANSAVYQNIFGGGNLAHVTDSTVVDINNGTVTLDVYGGGAFANTVGSNVTLGGGTVRDIYGGGLGRAAASEVEPIEAQVTGPVRVAVNSGTVRDVFGCNNVFGAPTDTVCVNINSNVTRNVYGGGNLAQCALVPAVYINNGTIGGSVFGGGNEAGVGGGYVNMINGTVVGGGVATGDRGGVFGGCNTSGVVAGDIIVSITGGTIGADGTAANVHGGGYGNGTSTTGDVDVTISRASGNNPPAAPVIWGDVYGGSAKGYVNTENGTDKTNVTLEQGTIHGNLYGGGLGDDTYRAHVYGDVQVTVNGGTVTDVFGCNNINGAPQDEVRVDINNDVSGNVYGGGNLAACSVSPTVYINNGTVGRSVFGGGLGSTAIVSGSPLVTVGDLTHSDYAAVVTEDVYGGGDAANVKGTTTVLVQKCTTVVTQDVYGGGNAADIAKDDALAGGTTSVTVTGGTIRSVYGGGHGDKDANPAVSADVVTSTSVTINGGTITQVFGGSNSKGTINGGNEGGINVVVEKDSDCNLFINELYGGGNYAASQAGSIDIRCTGTILDGENGHVAKPNNIGTTLEGIGTVYGGANRANITTDITLTIHNGMINRVFGGNNNSGDINANIQVNIDSTGNCWYVGDVYGGGDHAAYSGTPDVNMKKGTVYRNIFGGGNDIIDANNSAIPTTGVGGSDVEMTGGTVLLGVYGGCNLKGTVTGKSLVKIYGGTVGSSQQLSATTPLVAQVFGGGLGEPTRVNGDVEVNFGVLPLTSLNAPSAFPKLYGDIYGGSALGNVNTNNNNNTTIVNIYDGTLVSNPKTNEIPGTNLTYTEYRGGNVYGGCLGQKNGVNGATSDIEAKVNGKVTVNIGALDDTRTLDPTSDTLFGNAVIGGNVYGCNNTNGSPQDDVTVNICRTYRADSDQINYEPTSGQPATYAIANVFGGGNEADYMVSGKTLTVHIYNCYNSVRRVFGGGNAASGPNVHTIIDGGRFMEVFGGGNGERGVNYAADVTGDVDLEIHGGLVDEFYVGSNQHGTIAGTATVTVDQNSGCEEIDITEFFCGGKYADFIGNINATITCSQGMHVNNLYGGCKEANVVKYPDPQTTPNLSPELVELLSQHPDLIGTGGNVHLKVLGGTYDNIYGGSKGYIDPNNSNNNISADIEGSVLLEVLGGTVMNAIYGGSNILGDIAGTITVCVEDGGNDGCALDVSIADVYGGGNKANYNAPLNGGVRTDYPQVNIKNATVKNVFGGGLEAEVKGNPQIKIKNRTKVLGNVYGGGNMGVVDGMPKVTIDGQDNTANPTTFPTIP